MGPPLSAAELCTILKGINYFFLLPRWLIEIIPGACTETNIEFPSLLQISSQFSLSLTPFADLESLPDHESPE